MLPKDCVMLLSYINTKLRDEYPSLTCLCKALNVNENEIKEKLNSIGYTYNAGLNKFV